MTDWKLARRYQAAGLGLGGVLLKQSLYPRSSLLAAFEGARLVLDLGCGEGLLTNALARALPRVQFAGTDLDAEKIRQAEQCRVGPNAAFVAGDLFATRVTGASGVLFNDVLHHLSTEAQDRALALAAGCLDGSGVLVLKEVALDDALDKAHTTFWDRRIYPRDTLNFRLLPDWIALAGRHGFRLTAQSTVRHPWVASRSLLVFTQRSRLPRPRPAPAVNSAPPARVLVTGGTGFIGQWLLHRLLDEGIDGRPAEIAVITRRPWALAPGLRADPRVNVITADLSQPLPPQLLPGPLDYVFHLAAEVDFFGGQKTYRNNVAATANLLAALRGAALRRFVYASTMGALDRARGDRCDHPLDETSAAHPTSPYGRAKIAEENLVRESGLPAVILRIPWCYGPGMSRTHHVRALLGRVRARSFITRWAWPGRVSLVAAPAAAQAFVAAAQLDAAVGQTFFISDGAPVSFGELFAEMGRAVGNSAAGQSAVPRVAVWMARRLHFLLPFQAKALVCDALTVSDARSRPLGISASRRPERFLGGLAHDDARESWPSRWREFALVTGAAGGIGCALARQLHGRGHGLILVDRAAGPLANVAAELDAVSRTVDLSTLDRSQAAAQLAGPDAARVALLINNAGLGFRGGFDELDPAVIDATLAVNMRAVVFATMAFTTEMRRAGGGTIVNIASSAAYQPLPYMAAYAASKAFVLSFTLAAAAEKSAGAAVRLLAISPSGTRTDFQKSGGVKDDPKEKLLTPEATASAILDAAGSNAASVIIGRRGRAMALFARLVPTSYLVRTWETLMRRGR
ncbi:MAG: entA [Verrucomicrobia bacterium]|nr:entA [Verrucomicrobiota bacterium]